MTTTKIIFGTHERAAWRTVMHLKELGLSALALGLVAGCGGSAMTPAKLAASEGSVQVAEEIGTERVPQATLHLKLARDQLAKAKAASARGEGEAADRMLARAQVDAELATALAKEASAKDEAQLVVNEVVKARGEAR